MTTNSKKPSGTSNINESLLQDSDETGNVIPNAPKTPKSSSARNGLNFFSMTTEPSATSVTSSFTSSSSSKLSVSSTLFSFTSSPFLELPSESPSLVSSSPSMIREKLSNYLRLRMNDIVSALDQYVPQNKNRYFPGDINRENAADFYAVQRLIQNLQSLIIDGKKTDLLTREDNVSLHANKLVNDLIKGAISPSFPEELQPYESSKILDDLFSMIDAHNQKMVNTRSNTPII